MGKLRRDLPQIWMGKHQLPKSTKHALTVKAWEIDHPKMSDTNNEDRGAKDLWQFHRQQQEVMDVYDIKWSPALFPKFD